MRAIIADRRGIGIALIAVAAASLLCVALRSAGVDFVTAIVSTRPIAYYRLDATSGDSRVGSTAFRSTGDVESADGGAPIGIPDNRFVRLNGRDAYITTTQQGGVGETASMMAWVNLDSLPSAEGRIFYVMGESQVGNDLDVQFEQDNVLKFYTAAGGHLEYAPPRSALLHQWHMIVVTLDTASQSRVIYWDGAKVAWDKGGGRAGKTSTFTIGASLVFSGRWFKGGIDEVALWNRALRPSEVADIYAATNATAAADPMRDRDETRGSDDVRGSDDMRNRDNGDERMQNTTPPTTNARVKIKDKNGPIELKPEEVIAIMFLTAIQDIEMNCQLNAKHACSMGELLAGPKAANNWHISRLKYDPGSDPNYKYWLTTDGMAWRAHATPRTPGLAGFYFESNGVPTADAYYNPGGDATDRDDELRSRSISGDSFEAP